MAAVAEAAAEARPIPQLGRLWTYDEVAQNMEPEIEKPVSPPAHWPEKVRLDPARWVYWLPEGWGQGLKVTSGGKELKCYVNPEGKLYYHKVDIEKVLGQQLSRHEEREEAGDEQGAEADTAPQRWPERLPHDWCIAFKRQPTGRSVRVFVKPAAEGQEAFFFWHMKDVEGFLSGTRGAKGVRAPPHGSQRSDAKSENSRQTRLQAAEQPAVETPPSKRRRRQPAAEAPADEAAEEVGEEPMACATSTTKRPREGPTLSSLWASRTAAGTPSSMSTAAQALLTAAPGKVVEVSDSDAEDDRQLQPAAAPSPTSSQASDFGTALVVAEAAMGAEEARQPAAAAASPPRPSSAAFGASLAAAAAVDVEDGPPYPSAAAGAGQSGQAAIASRPKKPSARAEDEPRKQPRSGKGSVVRKASSSSSLGGKAGSSSSLGGQPAPPGAEAAPPPSAALAAGMSPASLEEFFQFLQCQICMEAREIVGERLVPEDAGAKALWPEYEAFVTPNLGATERWVPYHTALGIHEFFLIESVHHRQEPLWDAKRRFMAIFIFRAHCKRDFFTQAQVPHLLREEFWRDPVGAFAPEGVLEQSMREYRRRTKQPLLTLAMRMIPERLLQDDDDNLVRSIVLRTQRLLEVAEQIWPVIQDPQKPAAKRFTEISQLVQTANGLGETWAKMLSVCLDLAYPHLGLLASQCDVGVGAQAPLRALLPDCTAEEPREALTVLLKELNGSKAASSKHFWGLLPKVEDLVRQRYGRLPLILDQVRTERGKMTAVTLQVQLCEYRQFRNSVVRARYGLPGDDSMKVPDRPRRVRHEDHIEFDEAGRRVLFSFPAQEGQDSKTKEEPMEVLLAAVGGRRRLAERVASLCFDKLRDGAAREEVLAWREELCKQCKGSLEDVPDDSEAWQRCRVTLKHMNPLVSFQAPLTKVACQTTVKAAGSIMNAERIARLCWARFESGAGKEAVLAYRSELYRRGTSANGSLLFR